MPSIISHAIFSGALGRVFSSEKLTNRLFVLGMVCGMLPDADVIGFFTGVPYDSLFGHRGFTHSICFAVLTSVMVLLLFYHRQNLTAANRFVLLSYFFFATLSHPLLDAMTSGGLGVAFFSPFSNTRYFFPFRPIHVAHIGLGNFFRHNGIAILLNEFMWVCLPALAIFTIASFFRRRQY